MSASASTAIRIDLILQPNTAASNAAISSFATNVATAVQGKLNQAMARNQAMIDRIARVGGGAVPGLGGGGNGFFVNITAGANASATATNRARLGLVNLASSLYT